MPAKIYTEITEYLRSEYYLLALLLFGFEFSFRLCLGSGSLFEGFLEQVSGFSEICDLHQFELR